MRTLMIAAFLMLAMPASAADRTDKIKALMEAQGVLQIIDQQMELGKEESRKLSEQMMDQLLTSITPTPEIEARLRDASTEYLKAFDPPWTSQDIVNVWAEKYGSRFTDQELDGLLGYYTSPLGKKDVAAAQAATPEFMNYFMQEARPRIEAATQVYIERLQGIQRDATPKGN